MAQKWSKSHHHSIIYLKLGRLVTRIPPCSINLSALSYDVCKGGICMESEDKY